MGEFRFRIPEFWAIESRHIKTIHIVGLDGIPKPCSVSTLDDLLIVTRNQHESGRTYIAYPFGEQGELTICTGTLPESEQPYDLATELARGSLNRLRNQTSIWQEGGLNIPDMVWQHMELATEQLGASIVTPAPEKDELARASLDTTMKAIFALCDHFGQEISSFRVNESEIPSFWLATPYAGETMEHSQAKPLFDLLATHPETPPNGDRDIDERRIVGPLLDASPHSAFSRSELDFQSNRRQLIEHCRNTVQTLPKKSTLIHAACGLNGIGHRHLSYRQQIQLTTEILNLIDDSNVELPVLVSFDYPWAEKLAWSVGGIHPLQIADDLMRNGCKISFIGLDINLDYWPNGSVARDPLQWIDLIDVWCQLGLPLVLCLRVPQVQLSSQAKDIELNHRPQDNRTIEIGADSDSVDGLEDPVTSAQIAGNSIRDNLDETQRLHLINTILPMAVARPGVHGVFWRQWSDGQDPRYPHAGLANDNGSLKSITTTIATLRRETLKR